MLFMTAVIVHYTFKMCF